MKTSENSRVYTLRNAQLTCPNCKYEFPYNKNSLDKKINKLGQMIFEKNKLIKKIEKIPDETRNDSELKRIKKEVEYYSLMIFDLKQKRENLKQEEDRTNYENLKAIIKEFYGEKEFLRCIDEMLRRSSAYSTEDMMKLGYYSSSKGTPIRKV